MKKKKKNVGSKVPRVSQAQYSPETDLNDSEIPVWKCKRENCGGMLTLLGNVKKHLSDLGEARVRANRLRKEFPKTFVHGAKLSCHKCGDRPPGERRRHSSWQRLCQICGETYAMNGFWRMHGGVNHKGVRTDLKSRAHVHKSKLRKKFRNKSDIAKLDNMLIEEKTWLDLANRKIIDRDRVEISNNVLETHRMNQLQSNFIKTASSKHDVKSVLQKMEMLDNIRLMVQHDSVSGLDDVVVEDDLLEGEKEVDYIDDVHAMSSSSSSSNLHHHDFHHQEERRVRFNPSEIQQYRNRREQRKRERSRSSEQNTVKMSPKSPKLFVGASPSSPYDHSQRKSPGKRLEDISEHVDEDAAAFDALMQAEEEIAFFESGVVPRKSDGDNDDEDDDGLGIFKEDFAIFDDILLGVDAIKETESTKAASDMSSSFDTLRIPPDDNDVDDYNAI